MADKHNVQVSYEHLRSSGKKLKQGQDDLEQKLKHLKKIVDDLVQTGFVTDQASGKFQEHYEQWNKGAKNAVAGLEGMSKFLHTAVEKHEGLDQDLSKQSGN